jgi:hypothetical protein
MLPTPRHHRHFRLTHPVEYDALQRRVWILGQRCHHGAAGAIVAGGGVLGIVLGLTRRRHPPAPGQLAATVATAGAGALLMVHDWKDRSVWFQVGPGL